MGEPSRSLRKIAAPKDGYAISRLTALLRISRVGSEEGEGAAPDRGLDPISILEAMLFVGGEENQPVGQDVLQKHLPPGISMEQAIGQLSTRYLERNSSIEVAAESNGWRLRLREGFAGIGHRIAGNCRETKLSAAAMETLAVVAYRQPVTTEELALLRGKRSTATLRQLVRMGLLQAGRSQDLKTPLSYSTTPGFLRLIGLQSLADLPAPEGA